MIKPTKRKGFNFFRSYFDVYNELENNEDKVAFINALLNKQFLGIDPTEIKGMAKFAYVSQTNSIDNQVKGFVDKAKSLHKEKVNYNPFTGEFDTPCQPPCQGEVATPYDGGFDTPCQQEKEKVQGKEQVQVQEKGKEEEEEKLKNLINDTSVFISIDRFIELYPYYHDHHKVLCDEFKIGKQELLSKLGDFKKNRIKSSREISTNFGSFCAHFTNWIPFSEKEKKLNRHSPQVSNKSYLDLYND